MWLDGLVVVVIAFLAGFGARAGAAVAGLRLAALPLAYAGATAAGWAFGPACGRALGWSETAGALAAGVAGLLGVQLVLNLVTRVLRRGDTPDRRSQALGALFGALRGALLALPFLWLAALAEGARSAGVQPELPDLSGAQLPALGSAALGAGARHVLDQKTPSGRLVLGLMSHPTDSFEALRQVTQDPRVVGLQRDEAFWQDVERGAVAAALTRPAARALVADRTFRARLGTIGAVSPGAARDEHQFQVELALALAELGPRLQAVREDPAFAALLDDPQVRASVQSGNTLSLLRDARFQDVLTRATR